MPASGMRAVLVLHGPAHVRRGEARVKLRTKGLALLCILALDGPTRRERAADLLWGHADAATNLRVELHRLRESLASIGIRGFPAAQDPLELPSDIEVDRTPRPGAGQPLEGLDDLSAHFQAWLDAQRSLLGLEHSRPRSQLRQQLVSEVARRIVQPYVLVLKGPPGSGRHEFAKAVAGRLGLLVVETVEAAAPALHFLDSHDVDPEQVAHRVLRQRAGVWALTESAFGRESALLLLLHRLYPPERMRFIELGGLPWHEARSLVLSGLPFEEAARLYATTGGHVGYMRELLRMRPEQGFGPEAPLPQRIRAGYLLESRHLPDATRTVLELLSVHPGVLSDALLARLGFSEHLDALEETGWLRFDGGWSYRDEVGRRVLYRSLQAGRRAHYHARFAAAFTEVEGETGAAAAFHRDMAARSAATDALPIADITSLEWTTPQERAATPVPERRAGAAVRGDRAERGDAGRRGAQPPRTSVTYGRELALLLERHANLHVGEGEAWSSCARRARDSEPGFAVFALPDEPCLVTIEASWYAESLLDRDPAESVPLRLRFRGGPRPERQVLFLDAAAATCREDGTLLLPDRGARFVCDHRTLLVESLLETGVVEFKLRAFALGRGHAAGEAYDLVAASATTAPAC
jgi:hypothetical protein